MIRLHHALTVLIVIATAAVAQFPIEHTLHVETRWVPLRRAPGPTMSALRVREAVHAVSDLPYAPDAEPFSCDPRHLRRRFLLDQERILLGEPLLVAFQIEVEGPGIWHETIGGNYRARGRDDNFLFVMRRADGSFVADPDAPIWGYMGGLSTEKEVTQDAPVTYWHAPLRWIALEAPGSYELHCFNMPNSHTILGQREAMLAAIPEKLREKVTVNERLQAVEIATEKFLTVGFRTSHAQREIPPSPVVARIPEAVANHVRVAWPVDAVQDYAMFRVTVVAGTEVERAAMVGKWSAYARSDAPGTWPASRHEAACKTICYARQDDFLHVLADWRGGGEHEFDARYGLARRPSKDALEVLCGATPSQVITACWRLDRAHLPVMMPRIIDWIADENPTVAGAALRRIRAWTGETLFDEWNASPKRDPGIRQRSELRDRWLAWWKANEKSFVPR